MGDGCHAANGDRQMVPGIELRSGNFLNQNLKSHRHWLIVSTVDINGRPFMCSAMRNYEPISGTADWPFSDEISPFEIEFAVSDWKEENNSGKN